MKEKYEELRKKHDLPGFEEMDAYFEIGSIDEDSNILRETAKKIHDKVDNYTMIFESLIQADARLSNMREAGSMTPKERATLSHLYNKGMIITREALELGVEYSEEKAAGFIKKSFEEWKEMKDDILVIIRKMKKAWSEQVKIEEDRGYFG